MVTIVENLLDAVQPDGSKCYLLSSSNCKLFNGKTLTWGVFVSGVPYAPYSTTTRQRYKIYLRLFATESVYNDVALTPDWVTPTGENDNWASGYYTIDASKFPYTSTGYVKLFVTCESSCLAFTNSYTVTYMKTCSQPVKVVNKDSGAGIGTVAITAESSGLPTVTGTTDSSGNCTLTLNQGFSYYIYCDEKTGYTCENVGDCDKTLTVCDPAGITFRLKPISTTYNQPVRVKRSDTGEYITGVTVRAVSGATEKASCQTSGTYGECTLNGLATGTSYSIEFKSIPTGYECSTCSTTITGLWSPYVTLTLRPVTTTEKWKTVSDPYWITSPFSGIRIDFEAQNLLQTATQYEGVACVTKNTGAYYCPASGNLSDTTGIGFLVISESWLNANRTLPAPVDVQLKRADGTVCDTVTKTLPVKSTLKADINHYSGIVLNPSTCQPGAPYTIIANIANMGERADTPHYKVTVGGVVRVDEDGSASLPAPPDENTTVWTKELTAPDTVGAYIVSVKVWAKTDQTEVEADVQSMQLNVQSGCSPKWVTVSDPTWNNPTTIRIDYTMNECNLLSGFGFHGVIRFSDTVKVDGYSMTTESSSYAIISKQYLAEQGITTFPISNVNVDLVDDDLGWVWDSRTVTIPVPPVQKDVVVCDFNVLTSDGIKVTTLGVGVPYTVRAYVCMKEDILGIGGCKFGALGCSEGYTTPPTRFTCTLLATPTKTLKTGTTDSTCQASFSYTPSSSPVGTATLRMAFGSTSTTKAITADLPITILGDQLVINVENVPEHGCCLEILAKFLKVPFTNTWWAPIVIRKSVDVASTVTLTPSDGLVVGKDYAIRCVPRPATYPGLICWPESQTAETAEFFTFTGTVTKTVQGYTPAPGWMQWFCNRFGVSTTNCYSAWAEIPTELIFTQEAWCCWLNKTNLAGEPCTLTNWDRLYIGLDLFGIIPVGKVADIGVKGIARGAYLGKAVTLGDNAGFKVSEWLATKFAKRELLAKCFARMSDEKYVVTMGKLLDGELDEGETLIRSMLNTPDVRDKALVDLLKNQIDDILDVGKKGVGTADENAAAARAIAKESGTIVVHFDEAFAEASKHVSDIPALQKYFREVVLWKNMDEFDRAIVDSIQAGEEYLTKAIPGSEALHPTGIRLLDLYRVEGFIDDVRVTKLGTRLDFALDVAMQDIARDPDLFRKLVGGLELNDAVKIFNNLNARGKKTEAEVYHALRLAADYKLEDGAVDFLSRTAIILKDSVANGTDNTIKAAQSVFNSLQKIIKPTAEEAAKFGLVDNAVTTAPAHQKRFLSKLWGTIKSVIERKSGKAWASLSNSERLLWYLRSFFSACFMLFIAEEALQIAACFSVFPASGFIDQYWYQRTTVEKKQDIADYKGAVDRARTFWWVVVINESPFFILCPEFAPMYLAFSKGADMYLDEHEKNATKLESLINPTGNFTGNLRISANVNDVSIIINGMSYKQKAGTYPLDYLVPIDDVSVINEYTVQGDKVGYLTDIKTAQLSSADITPGGGYPTRNVYLELKPVSNVPGYTDATGIVTSPDTLREEIGGESYYNHMPTNLGGTVDNELWFSGNVGNIYCESTPQNAKIWIKGGQYTDWFDTARSTNWTITSIVVGSYQIKYTSPGYFDCIVPVNVVADQTAQANCIMQKILPPASLRCINPQPTSLTLAWAPPSITSTYLSQLKSYLVYKGAAQIATVGHVAGKTSYEYTVTNLTANTQYVFSVYSVTTGDIVSQDPATVSCTTSSICPKVTSVSIAPSTKTIKVGDSLTFTPSGSPGSGATLTKAQWQFSDTGTTTTVTPPDNILKTVTHTYTKTSGTTPFTVKLTLWNDCGESTVSSPAQITVETPIEPTGTIRCYCAGYPVTDEYCKRGADILYRKVGATTWSTAPVKTGYDAQLVVPEGQYQIKYNLMGVMESDIKTVTVSQAAAVTYQEQLAFGVISETGQRVVPSVPTQAVVDGANSILTTVTAVLDGDTIQTAWTDNTTVFPAPSGRTTQVVRIGGYDAFEYDQTNPTSTPMGVYAKNKLASLLLIGSVVTIKVHKYSPLDLYNRVLAAAERVAAGVDVTRDMLSSCYVKAPASGYKTGLWADWDAKYLALYKDPYGTSCLRKTDPQGNPYIKITDIDVSTRTFKLTNAWATVYAYAQWSKAGAVQGRTEIRSLASSSTSTAYAYSIGADTIELFACLDSERDCTCLDRPTEADNATCIARWVRVDTKFITVPIYKSVTLQSVPNCTNMVIDGGAPVSCGSAVSRLQQTLKRRRVRP